jgi:histidinol dehydrogenase
MKIVQAGDPILEALLADPAARFRQLEAAAEPRARAFYRAKLGEELSIRGAIERIFADVERDGDQAVARYGRLFDGAALPVERLRVGADEIRAALAAVPASLRSALELAAERIATYQRRLLPRGFGEQLDEPLGVRWLPFDRAAGYVPGGAGGSVPLCSSVLMNLVPAKVAGVPSVVLATPPRPDGSVAPEILAAAAIAGVDEVYRVGGVQAVAALTIGTPAIPKVDCLVGPGNLFVTLAKRHAYGRVAIDMPAGPSEVLVLADGSCAPAWAAADLLSQAEHDPLAMPMLVAWGEGVAAPILAALQQQLAALPAERRSAAEASVRDHGLCVTVRDAAEALAIINRAAPEHLELLVRDPAALLPGIRHAGAVFCGPWSTEPIGDYVAGPSHTLPTGGGARLFSGIGVDTFLRRSSIINLDEAGFRALAPAGIALARAEGLEAHARAMELRLG